LDALLFLQGLLYGKDLIFGLEVEGLFSARERFNEDLGREQLGEVDCGDVVTIYRGK